MASARLKSEPKPVGKSPADLLVLERFLPYRLSILSNRVSRAIAKRYAKAFGLTIPEWRIIAVLGRRPGLNAKEVAEATEMDKVAVSRAAARLIASGRVAAETHEEDGRKQVLRLTLAGAAVHARIAPIALENEQRLLATLTPDEQAHFDELVDRLLDAAKQL
jgi:DNA-binding MarR family transcriptional regulator